MALNPTHQTWNKLADLYQEKFMDLKLYDTTYDHFIDLLPQHGATILELGCGPGNITRYLLQKRPDYKILATDVAPNMIELAKQNNPSADCQVLAVSEIRKLEQSFDAILMGFCLPYLQQEEFVTFLQDAHQLLLPKGILYFSTIEGDYQDSTLQTGSTGDQMQVYYYDERMLKEKLEANGFEVLDVIRIPYRRSDGGEEVHLVVIGSLNNILI